MAEQSNDPVVTPGKKEFSSRKMAKNDARTPGSLNSGRITRRSSTGSDDNGDNARRNSSEKRDSANVGQHAIPHYLRASTGSCHDICKYGRRHSFEEKTRKPLRKRAVKPSLNELNSIQIIVLGEQKKENVKHEPSVSTEKLSLLVKSSPDAKSFLPNFKASLDAKAHSRRLNASSSGKTRAPNSPTKKSTSPETPENVEVPVKEGNSIDNRMSRVDKKTFDQSMKHSSSVRSKPVQSKSSSASENSCGVHGKGRRNGDVQTGRKMSASASMASANKPAAAHLFPKCSLSKMASDKAIKSGRVKLLSPGKDQNRIDRVETETSNGQVSEKTLHVIETETGNNPLESPSSPVSLSHANPSPLFQEEDNEGIQYSGYETEEFASDNMASREIGKVKPVKENHKHLKMGSGENALESIPDENVIPAPASPSSPVSLSHENPSPMFNEKDDEGIEYDGDEFVTDNIVSIGIDKVQPVKENHNQTLRMETEKKVFDSIRAGHVIPALPTPSSSSSHSKSPSLSSHEECGEQIKCIGKEAGKLVSGKLVTVKISKVMPLKENHNKYLRKSRVVSSGDKYFQPVKLKFRSGSVVNVHLHQDNNIPRRLRLRRIRVTGNKADFPVSDNKKSVEIGNIQPVKENNMTLRKTRVVVSKDKRRSPVRLFRSENGASLQPDNNIPWRIRFRRARIIGVDDRKGDLKRIIRNAGGEYASAGASLKVNLKHQDLQGKKKSAQCLLNNVIEETASKLVDSRKSKVKALVGAFETVISLQKRKPS